MTANYSVQYHDSAPNVSGFIGQPIRPFTTINLAFGYEWGDDAGVLGGTSLRLNIDNALDAKPMLTPRSATNIVTYANWTLGRVIKLGFQQEVLTVI